MSEPKETDRELIARLRKLEEAATPGPWRWERSVRGARQQEIVMADGYPDPVWEPAPNFDDINDDDARLLVAAHNALPALLALAERGLELAERYPDHCYRCERPCRYAGLEPGTGAARCAACLAIASAEAERDEWRAHAKRLSAALRIVPVSQGETTICVSCGHPRDDDGGHPPAGFSCPIEGALSALPSESGKAWDAMEAALRDASARVAELEAALRMRDNHAARASTLLGTSATAIRQVEQGLEVGTTERDEARATLAAAEARIEELVCAIEHPFDAGEFAAMNAQLAAAEERERRLRVALVTEMDRLPRCVCRREGRAACTCGMTAARQRIESALAVGGRTEAAPAEARLPETEARLPEIEGGGGGKRAHEKWLELRRLTDLARSIDGFDRAGEECVACRCPISIDAGSEPSALCYGCAQAAAADFAAAWVAAQPTQRRGSSPESEG